MKMPIVRLVGSNEGFRHNNEMDPRGRELLLRVLRGKTATDRPEGRHSFHSVGVNAEKRYGIEPTGSGFLDIPLIGLYR